MSDSISASGDFRVGDVLARAWNIFTGNMLFFVGVTLVMYVAMGVAIGIVVIPIAFAAASGNAAPVLIAIAIVLAIIVFFGLNTIGQGVLLLGAFQRMRGQPLQVNEALQRAFARSLPLIGLGFLAGLCIILGSLAFIVPGVILFCMWAVAAPACIVEGLGPTASMSRSSDLTRGFRWKIFAIVLLLYVINGIGGQIVELTLGLASSTLASIGGFLWLAAWTALFNCTVVMMYHDLRVAKEGIDTEQIAAIFD
jgi:hypothetical protein